MEELNGKEYKEYTDTVNSSQIPGRMQTGFFSESVADHILAKVWEIFNKYQHDKKIKEHEDPVLDCDYWKLNFTVHEPICEEEIINAEEGAEEEFAESGSIPMISANVSCIVKAVEMHEDSPLPKKTYVNFKYKGNK